MEQRTPEWYAARCGKVTASKVHDIVARTKSGYTAGRKNYEAQLIAERLTGEVADSFSSPAMEWGMETEPQAILAYEFVTGLSVQPVGFVDHPDIEMSGASPDGLVGDMGMVEVKCPNTATHLATLLGSKIKAEYISQIRWQLCCTEREWCDFVSFDPRLPAHLQLYRQRIFVEDEDVQDLEGEVKDFIAALEDKIARLENVEAAA